MSSHPSRSARRRQQKKRHLLRNSLIALALLLLLAIPVFSLTNWFSLTKNQETTVTSTSSTTTETHSETTTSSRIEETATEETLVWEKQKTPVSLPILMYHAIHDMLPEEAANANLIVAPAVFESHLQALQDAGYYTVSPEEAYKILTENVLPQGKKVVWLTFDDSMVDFYHHAFPLLKQYNMKATNNVITGFTEEGRSGNLSIDQMKEMKQYNLSFQGHTVTHPDLEQSDTESQTYQLQVSKEYLDTQLNQNTIAVAYPAGRYSQDTLAIAESLGYKLGVTTNNGLASASDGLLSLNRVRILPSTTAEFLLESIATPE